MKLVHIIESLGHNAIESWLVRMLAHARLREVNVDWTFYCLLDRDAPLERAALDLGARVLHSAVPIGRKVAFVDALRRELRRGAYDVIHCHHDLVSALYLIAAMGTPVRRRIVHVHNADEAMLTPSRVKQRLLREPARRICLAAADRIVGISNHTLDTFLAGRPRRIGRDSVLYYGVDPTPFERASGDRIEFRRGLGLADDARILLFASRMVPEKNPLFAVDVFAELHRHDPSVAGVFVGSGSLEQAVLKRAAELGVTDAFRPLGWRNDLPAVMCCCDWFILPRPEHPKEGFGLAVVEAQLAGLRLLLSEGILPDPLLPNAAYRRLSLESGPVHWARAAEDLLQRPAPSPAEAQIALAKSPFNMDTALSQLLELYQ